MFVVGCIACQELSVWVARGWIAAAIVVSAFSAPIVPSILAPARLQNYMKAAGIRPAPIEAAGVGAPLTQGLSDEFGWRELEQKVAAVFHQLSPDDHARRYWLRITGKPLPSTSMAAPTVCRGR